MLIEGHVLPLQGPIFGLKGTYKGFQVLVPIVEMTLRPNKGRRLGSLSSLVAGMLLDALPSLPRCARRK